MSEIQSATAGIILLAWDEGTPVALLQRRAEGHTYARSFCQTGHGGAEPDELSAIRNGAPTRDILTKVALRELKEEAGPRIAIIVRGIMTRNGGSLEKACLKVYEEFDSERQNISATFVLDTRAKSKDLLKLLEPSVEGTGFMAVSLRTKLLVLQPGHKVAGAPRGRDIYMRAFDIAAVQEGLKQLSNRTTEEKLFI